jgi:hypothetical protein
VSLRPCRWRLAGDDITPAGWLRFAGAPSVVLVGLTGVGKSTALRGIETVDRPLALLPDRRELTDEVMIRPLAGNASLDREARFALTARYRDEHPGGMAEALEVVIVEASGGTVVFDGLRGENEVAHAAQAFALARFVALEAPDTVRVRRLLGRGDAFDRAAAVPGTAGDLTTALRDISGAEGVFSFDELEALAAMVEEGFSASDVVAKVRIVVTERLNYDPVAARSVLERLAPKRSLFLDTSRLEPSEVASRVAAWL